MFTFLQEAADTLSEAADPVLETIVAPESEAAAQAASAVWWMLPVFIVGVYAFGLLVFGKRYGFNPLKWRIGSRA